MAQQFGKYELTRLIAIGGMAEVFLARQSGPAGFEKRLVVKRILPQFARDQKFIQMFLDEARLAAQLSHPNIVQIYELGREQGSYYIAMEFISGEALIDLLQLGTGMQVRIPYHYAARIVASVCAGLDYAHSFKGPEGDALGLVHRDISPDNILVSENGAVKTIDFGIAKANTNRTKTQSGAVKGKFCYMSPEQVMGDPLDGRSDVFSLGIVLYELVTGQRPFGDDAGLMTVSAIVNEEPNPPSQLDPDIPAELERIIVKALDKDRDSRYQRARDMQRDLDSFVASHAVHVADADVGELVTALKRGEPRDIMAIKRLQAECLSRPNDSGVSQVSGSDPGSRQSAVGQLPRGKREPAKLKDLREKGKFGGVGVSTGHLANMATPAAASLRMHYDSKRRQRSAFVLGMGVVVFLAAVAFAVFVAGGGPDVPPGGDLVTTPSDNPVVVTVAGDAGAGTVDEDTSSSGAITIRSGTIRPRVRHDILEVGDTFVASSQEPDATQADAGPSHAPDEPPLDEPPPDEPPPDQPPIDEPPIGEPPIDEPPDAGKPSPIAISYMAQVGVRVVVRGEEYSGAMMYVDGKYFGRTPKRLQVSEGRHVFEVRAGRVTARKESVVRQANHNVVTFKLKGGYVTLADAPPGVACRLDGESLKRKEFARLLVPPGKHVLECDDLQESHKSTTVNVKKSADLTISWDAF